MQGLFVTGTDTDVGKTMLSGALLAAMTLEGERVSAYKPVLTGLDQPAPIDPEGPSRLDGRRVWPQDHELLAAAAGMDPEEVAPIRFGPSVSPHLAASLAGEEIEPAELLAGAGRAAREGRIVIVEGVGGLLVPLAADYTVRDLAAALGLGVLIAARPGLGTINHTLLTLEAARAAGLEVRAVVLTPWPAAPSALERSNRETVARLGAVEVETLSRVGAGDLAELARAGQCLPWRRWLGDRPDAAAADPTARVITRHRRGQPAPSRR